MKKLLIAASICTIPFCILGIINPLIYWQAVSKTVNNWFWVYVVVFAVCLGVILSALLTMTRYTKNIERLDVYEKELEDKNEKLDKLIRQYNKLIASNI